MKKIALVLVIIVSWGCNQDKIGYVDTVRLMEKNNEKSELEAKYQDKSTSFNKRRDSISQAFQLEAQAIQAKAESMSQSKAQEEFDLLQQRGQFIGQQLQQEEQILQQQGQAEMDSLVQRVRRQIQDYGKAQGYTFILGGGDGGSVLYGVDAKDLTDEIIEVVNSSKKQ
ncbi:MAG: OmpH family outer membrane protein [Flavobacteriaceae bacterium]